MKQPELKILNRDGSITVVQPVKMWSPTPRPECPFCKKPLWEEGLYECGSLVGASAPETGLCSSGLLAQYARLVREMWEFIHPVDRKLFISRPEVKAILEKKAK